MLLIETKIVLSHEIHNSQVSVMFKRRTVYILSAVTYKEKEELNQLT